MNIPFSQELNGKPTYFAEKIWSAIDSNLILVDNKTDFKLNNQSKLSFFDNKVFRECKPKLHTIRDIDKFKNLKEGSLIHCVYNNRQKNRLQFAPTFTHKGKQLIEIEYIKNIPYVHIDGKYLITAAIHQLAINDGFECMEDFFAYFNTAKQAYIHHFTNFKY